MGTYRPIRTVASAVPDRLRELGERIDSLSVMTSGQVNSTSPNLARTASEVPVITTISLSESVIPAGGSDGVSVVSQKIAVPDGKRACQIMATLTASMPRNGTPTMRISLGGELSPPLPVIQDGSGLRHIIGSHSAIIIADKASTITVEALIYTNTASPDSRVYLNAMLAFMS